MTRFFLIMKIFILFIISILSFGNIVCQSQSMNNQQTATNNYAPITTASSIGACVNGNFNISINVNNFTQISAISLRLEFNPNLMIYNSYSNINLMFNGVFVNSVLINPNLRIINIVWTDINSVSLANGSKIVDLNFTLLSGSPVLHFNNISNSGGDCEYADLYGNSLIDNPDTLYYKDAKITNLTLGNLGIISGSQIICSNQNSYNYSVPALLNATSYIWTFPNNNTVTTTSANIDINSNVFTNGNLQVKAQNICGESNSSLMAITLKDLPNTPVSIDGLFVLCQNYGNTVYTVTGLTNANSYIWNLSNGFSDTTSLNNISVFIGSNAVSGNISVKGFNECGYGESKIKYIKINSLPDANAGADMLVCKNDTVTLSASGGVNYQWNNGVFQNMPFVASNTADYVVVVTDSNNCTKTDTLNLQVKSKYLSLKFYLEGFYADNGLMNNVLDEYGNPVCGIENTDFVLIEIRESNPPFLIKEMISKPLSKSGFLFSEINCKNVSDYYIVINHRNHIETWSANPLSFASDTIFYDFTTSASKAYGNNQKEILPVSSNSTIQNIQQFSDINELKAYSFNPERFELLVSSPQNSDFLIVIIKDKLTNKVYKTNYKPKLTGK